MKKNNIRILSLFFVAILVGYVIIANYLGNKLFFRLDITESKYYTLSDVTKEKLSNLEDVVSIELFFSENLPPSGKKLKSRVADIVSEFQRYAKGKIEVNWHDPTLSNDALQLALALKVPKVAMEGIDADKLGQIYFYHGLAVRYNDRSEAIPTIKNSITLEKNLLQRVINVTAQSLPEIGILKTDTITPIPQEMIEKYGFKQSPYLTFVRYEKLFKTLISSYNIKYVDLSKGEGIPANLKTLIIPGGRDDFYTEAILREIDRFVTSGGNIIALVPRIDINLARSQDVKIKEEGLFPLLKFWGIDVKKELILDSQCDYMGVEQGDLRFKYPYFPIISDAGFNKEHPVTSELAMMILQWASPLELSLDSTSRSAYKVDTLLKTTANSFTKKPPIGLAPDQKWDQIFARNQRLGTPFKEHPVAMVLTGTFSSFYKSDSTVSDEEKADSRVAVIGADGFVTNEGMGGNNNVFIQNLSDWLTIEQNLISIRTKTIIDRRLQREGTPEELNRQEQQIRIFNIFAMPLLLAIVGLIILINRKKAQRKEN